MNNSSFYWFDNDDKTKYILSQSLQGKWVNWKHTASYIVCYTGIQGLNYPELPSLGILGNKEII